MERLALRSVYLTISSNQNFSKSISPLAKITQLQYSDKANKELKMKCIQCGETYQSVFMLMLHIQLTHFNVMDVKKYQIFGDTMMIQYKQTMKRYTSPYQRTYVEKLSTEQKRKPAFYLKFNIIQRCKGILNNIIAKIQKAHDKQQQIFFHSNDIFVRVNNVTDDQNDSEEDIGEIQMQLEKLKIQDFSDINSNDKQFFIKWNTFIHNERKKMTLIYPHDMPTLYIEFAKLAPLYQLNRLNMIMHGWTLWSVGQIKADHLISALKQFDKANSEI